MAARSFTVTGIVLKRYNTGETDRIVTILSQEMGKITTVAKGVRKLHSSKRAVLEPGNYVKAFCIATHSMPILTQATLIEDTATARETLKKMRQLHQFLEIMDQLFVEEELEVDFFDDILNARRHIISPTGNIQVIRAAFEKILVTLGYHDPDVKLTSILEKVSELTERPLRSYEYLVVKSHKD